MSIFINATPTNCLVKVASGKECYFSHNKLRQFINEGYVGYDPVTNMFSKEFENFMKDPDTLYRVDEKYAGVSCLTFNVPVLPTLEHDEVQLMHRGYHFTAPCKETSKVIRARVVGERFSNGLRRTIFECNCCRKLFAVDHLTAMFLRQVYPQFAEVFASHEDVVYTSRAYENGEEYKDVELVGCLELMARTLEEKDFMNLLGSSWEVAYHKCEKAIASIGYRTFHEFYLVANGITYEAKSQKQRYPGTLTIILDYLGR